MHKAILFDLDGVLVDACEWHFRAFNQALEEVTGCIIPIEDHEKNFNGLPSKEKLRILVNRGLISGADIKEVWDRKQYYTLRYIEENLKPIQQKITLLSNLHLIDFKLACVTNCHRIMAIEMLTRAGLIQYFDLVLSCDECKHSKPHPEIYVRALLALNASLDDSLIIEDSPKGIEGAKLVGCKVLAVKDSTEVTWNNIMECFEK